MPIYKLLFLWLALMTTSKGIVPHAIYLAVVQIDHSDVDSDAQILVKVFKNDLQDVIRAAYPAIYKHAEDETFCNSNKQAIEQYFQTKLNCQINGKGTLLTFLEGTRENDVYWLKFNMDGPRHWQKISIQASFFMEIFSTQSNIIQVIYSTEKRFARLTQKNQSTGFEF